MSKRQESNPLSASDTEQGSPQSACACRGKVYSSILETVGATPLVDTPRLHEKEGLQARLLLKLEFFNPLASVKDRIGLSMIRDAENRGLITPGRTVLVEPTSGNTGISLAFVAAARGYRLIVTMPENASTERRKMMRLLDAELELTPSSRGMAGAIERARALVDSLSDAWMPAQFDNPSNPDIHARTTAEEIWTDTKGDVDLIVAGLGTGGTLTGIARTLTKRKPTLNFWGVEPSESAVLHGDRPGPHGIQGIGPGFCPNTLDTRLLTGVKTISEREAIEAARLCARVEGIPIGISSGAALSAAITLARDTENASKTIVAIVPSFAERYLSTSLFTGLV